MDKFSLIFFQKKYNTSLTISVFYRRVTVTPCDAREPWLSVASSACPLQTSLLQPSYTVTHCCPCLFADGSCVDITTELIGPCPNGSGVIEFLSREMRECERGKGLAVLHPAMRSVGKAADQQCVACDGVPRAFDDS
jgi:hypothetical protein